MAHSIERQTRARAAGVGACRSKTPRVESLSNEQNNSERFPNDPVLEIKDTEPGKGEKTEKRQQLAAALILAVGRSAKKMETQRSSRGRRFTTSSIGIIQAVN